MPKENLSLFDIGTEFYALADLMEDEFDEETGELIDKSEAIRQLFTNLKMKFEDKLDNCQKFILTLKGEQEALDKEIKRLQAKKTASKNKEDRLKNMMLGALEVSGMDKVKTSLYNFSVGKSEAVQVVNDDEIPRSFLKISYSADKVKIKKAIKDGATVDGCKLVENKSLRVR